MAKRYYLFGHEPVSGPVIPTDGLNLYYDYGNTSCYPGSGATVFDLSGNSNDGALTNTAIYSASDGGRIDLQVYGDTINIPHDATLQPTSGMSVAFFVNIQSGVLTGVGCLHNSPNRGWALLGGTSSAFRAYLAPSATTLKLVNSSSEPTQIKQWALLSMRFSPSTFLDATVNTALGAINTTSIPATSYDNGLDVVIGNRGDGGSPMIGYLGPIMIYNRAITDSELTQIFDAFKARYGL